jgi:hypothetical protein
MQLRTLALTLTVALGALIPAWATAQVVPVGPQFQVNTYTTDLQNTPAVAADAGGNFVVTWYGAPDSSTSGVFARRYDGNGMALADQFQVNAYTTGSQASPSVAADAAGNFVVVWADYAAHDGNGSGVFAQRYDGSGSPIGSELQVNTYTTGDQAGFPAVAASTGGDFVVTWSSYGQDGRGFGIFAQRFDSNGMADGSEFQVNGYTTNDQRFARIAADSSGNFVVVWRGSGDQDGSYAGVFGRRYDGNGVPQGGEFQVNSYTTNDQLGASVAFDPTGDFVVVWSSDLQDGSSAGAFGKRYDANGMAVGGEFQLNSYTTGIQGPLAVEFDAGGSFVVALASSDGDGFGVFARHFDAGGTPLGPEFLVNAYTTGNQLSADLAMGPAGTFVIVWPSFGQDGDSGGVFGQRFALPTTTSTSTTSTTLPPRLILGRKMLVKDPNGLETGRGATILGRESATDVGPAIVGDPTVSGATLRVIANGGTPSDETYVLDAAGWTAISTGYAYVGPTDVDADPVKKVILKRTPSGTALLKAILRGNVGIQPMNVVPSDPGTGGGIILNVAGSVYCVGFGNAAAGSVVADTSALWKIVNATGQGCPSP